MLEKDSGAAEVGGRRPRWIISVRQNPVTGRCRQAAFGAVPEQAGLTVAAPIPAAAIPTAHSLKAVRRPSPQRQRRSAHPRSGPGLHRRPGRARCPTAPAFVPLRAPRSRHRPRPRATQHPRPDRPPAAAAASTRTSAPAGATVERARPTDSRGRLTTVFARGGPSAAHLALGGQCRCQKPPFWQPIGTRLDSAAHRHPGRRGTTVPGSADRRPDRLVRQRCGHRDRSRPVGATRGSGPGFSRPCHPTCRSPNSGGNCCRPPVGGTGYRGWRTPRPGRLWREQACWTRR